MNNNQLILSNIENAIFTIRGLQVMIDKDLAAMYQVETKVLNQAIKRNIERFPENFRFQLNKEETEELVTNSDKFGQFGFQNASSRSQIVTLNNNKQGQNIKYNPYAFTEQGVAMLSAVLKSDIAIQVSIQIINAFVAMRKTIANNQGIIQRLEGVEKKQLETDQKFEQVFKALEGNTIPTQGVFFDGQVFDAYQLTSKIIRTAKKSIVLIDNYIDETVLVHLSKKNKNVAVNLLTKNISKQLHLDVQKANAQYGNFAIKPFATSHDRFLIIDEKEVYHLGASLKDLGKKWFAFSKMDKTSVQNILNEMVEII
jgi:3-dehydroquinate dehydratase